MNMEGSRTLAFAQGRVWQALNDPDVLKVCIPGCERIEASGENQYAVGVTVKIGPVSAKFVGKIELSDIKEPYSYTLSFEGQGGGAGFGKGKSQVELCAVPAGCELRYTVSASVGGKIAQMGQRLIDGVAKSMAEDFFKRFDAEVQRRFPGEAIAAVLEAGKPAAPGRQGFVAGLPAWAWAAGGAVLVALAWMLLR